MKSDYLKNLTAEQRVELREKAKASREAKKLAGAILKNDFADEPHWRELASKIGFRMPATYIPCSETKHLKKALKLCNIDPKEWAEIEGYSSLKGFGIDNPDWPAYARIGTLLEHFFFLRRKRLKKQKKQRKLVSNRNPVAKNMHKVHKPSVQRDRTKYKRNPKHKQEEI